MTDATSPSRPPNAVRRANSAQRSSYTRGKLISVAAPLFVERGIANVSVEQLIETANISRATFYGCFANKNELAAAILSPVIKAGIVELQRVAGLAPRQAAEALVDVYLHLLKQHRNALLLTGNLGGAVFPYIRVEHEAYHIALQTVLRVIDSGGLLRNDCVELTTSVLAKTAIPLLRIYKDCDDLQQIYPESMRALLFRPIL